MNRSLKYTSTNRFEASAPNVVITFISRTEPFNSKQRELLQFQGAHRHISAEKTPAKRGFGIGGDGGGGCPAALSHTALCFDLISGTEACCGKEKIKKRKSHRSNETILFPIMQTCVAEQIARLHARTHNTHTTHTHMAPLSERDDAIRSTQAVQKPSALMLEQRCYTG